jgi:hypothetical protein
MPDVKLEELPKVMSVYSRISSIVYITKTGNVSNVNHYLVHKEAINEIILYVKAVMGKYDVTQNKVYIDAIDAQIANEDIGCLVSYYNAWIDEKALQELKIHFTKRYITDVPDCGLIARSELPEEEVPCKLCKNKVKPSEPICWWCEAKNPGKPDDCKMKE